MHARRTGGMLTPVCGAALWWGSPAAALWYEWPSIAEWEEDEKEKSSFKKILFSCSPSLDRLEKKEEVAGAWRAGMGQNAIEVIRNTCISWEAGRKLDIGKECSVVFDLQVW